MNKSKLVTSVLSSGLVALGLLAVNTGVAHAATDNGNGTVTVQAGDTYAKIAQSKNLSIASLEKLNGRAVGGFDLIYVGDIVKTSGAVSQPAVTQTPAKQQPVQQPVQQTNTYSGSKLTASAGVNYGPSGKETYYNQDMSGVLALAQSLGINGTYGVRADGVKTFNGYVLVAANTQVHPKGSYIQTSLGMGIVLDHCVASETTGQIDIATTW